MPTDRKLKTGSRNSKRNMVPEPHHGSQVPPDTLTYHAPTNTIYLVGKCPLPSAECRTLKVADLPTAQKVVVGRHTIELTCSPVYQGYLITLGFGREAQVVTVPNELLQAAQNLANCFNGAVVFDPDGDVEKVWDKLWSGDDQNSVDGRNR